MKKQLLFCILLLLVSAPPGLASENPYITGEAYDETAGREYSPESDRIPARAPRTQQPAATTTGQEPANATTRGQEPANVTPRRQEPRTTTPRPVPRTTTNTRTRTAPERSVISTPRSTETQPGTPTPTPVDRRKRLQWDSQPPSRPATPESAAPTTGGQQASERPQWGKSEDKPSLVPTTPKWGKTSGE